ncbi:MAG TPA: dihydropteroate synthase [Steroidobacteraceae bacterium]|jgi:dihydropteroate synthase|nr:dihydropteroate synthase [Steroidobacteraceae bacterium]
MLLLCGSHRLDLSTPLVMGVLNVTPDSFSDGGRYAHVDAAVAHALRMIAEGAALIDIGGESTRPGAQAVDADEEIRRVVPVIEALAARAKVLISVDTSKPAVMIAAVRAGATLINDVRALREPGALEAAAASGAAVCLMHMQGEPRTMQVDPRYGDVVAEVRDFLHARAERCMAAGIARDRLVLDPGIGFGKRLEHNLALLAALPALVALGWPVLVGVSRKSMFDALLGRAVDERVAGGVAMATAAVLSGASIVRTHDVAPTVDAVKVATALKAAGTL